MSEFVTLHRPFNAVVGHEHFLRSACGQLLGWSLPTHLRRPDWPQRRGRCSKATSFVVRQAVKWHGGKPRLAQETICVGLNLRFARFHKARLPTCAFTSDL